MKTIGTQVQFLRPDSRYCRRGEGAFLRLDSGAILNVYSAYPGPAWNDHAEAELAAQISDDGGKTWSPERTIIRRDPDAVNVMSVSLLPMQDGAAGLFYIQKYRREGRIVDRYLLRRSYDGGMTWGESSVCIPDTTYSIINNDRVVRLSDGRIAIPVSQCETDPDDPYRLSPGCVCLFLSDDDGRTFRQTQILRPPFINDEAGLQEPGVFEHADGTLRMWMRTALGFQFESFSHDGGETWTQPQPNFQFTSPCSPMQLKRAGAWTLAVFNPVPTPCAQFRPEGTFWKLAGRTPLVCAVSEDGGESFRQMFCLESDPDSDYCYPAVFPLKDGALISYYHSCGTRALLSGMKTVFVPYTELDALCHTVGA